MTTRGWAKSQCKSRIISTRFGDARAVTCRLTIGLVLCCLIRLTGAPTETVDFNFHVRPILSDRCFKCHGPDEKARKAKLRLDLAEHAYAVRDPESGRRAIVPGHPEQSALYHRITTEDTDDLMPPPESHLSLNDQEKAVLRRWIEQGAAYKPHWAFIAVNKPPVPTPANASQARNAIDAFVLERLEHEDLQLSPEASREQLIRRLSFDLLGLPPTLEEIDAVLKDSTPNAYERLVDRLLASPAYGERRATEWLDLARYADTYGYQSDVEYDMSPWRDWVIHAFNDNLPYDQFVLWQLAGDLLPAPTREQVLATAVNRLHRQTNEGGSIEEEFRTEYVADRLQTASTAFLGLTMECARCHDHKYDPIKQRDYYRMFAFFNNIDESGLYSHFTTATPSPSLLLYREGEEAQHQALKEQIQSFETKLVSIAGAAQERFSLWLNSGANEVTEPAPAFHYAFEEITTNRTPNRLGTNAPAVLVDHPEQVQGIHARALLFNGDNGVVCKGAGEFNRTTPFSFSLWLQPSIQSERAVIFHRSRAWTDSGSRGYELVMEQGRPTFGLIHFWPGNALQVRAKAALPTNEWSLLTITYDGSSRAEGLRLFRNGEPLPVDVVRDQLFKDILHRKAWNDVDVGNVHLTLANRFRDAGFKGGLIDEFKIFDRCLTALEVKLLASGNEPVLDQEALHAYYLHRVDLEYQALRSELQQLREKENALVNDVPEIMVMKEMPTRRPTFVLKRGAYDAPGEPVDPGVPEFILPDADSMPRNRLGLAQWMVDPRNPLVARAQVNRVWRAHFGRGLVATAENFGSQGQLPTHPELLDWLASTFMNSGWDLKALHKLIVMSATYRQTSWASPDLRARDPENQWLARGPKRRLEAEQIRDHALAVSSLLSRQVGGPSVRPYQPAGLWEESGTGKRYVQDSGEKLYRRSLYTFWKRTLPPPNMLTFDATTREVCTARRETTTTPLQALVLLNDPQFVEAARVLAENLVRELPLDASERIRKAYRMIIGRFPSAPEQEILRRLFREQLVLFKGNMAGAANYVKIGDHPIDQTLPLASVAATTVLTSTLMNLDEFVNER